MKGGNDKGGEYTVGRGRPPKDKRWKRGQSGNPRGRPKGAAGTHKFLAHLQPAKAIIWDELYASVTVRDGDRVVKMPAIQAVLKATLKAAFLGSPMAARTILTLNKALEDEAAQKQGQLFDGAFALKRDLQIVLGRCAAEGRLPPYMIIHPDELELDGQTLSVRYHGPSSLDELETKLESLRQDRDTYLRSYMTFRTAWLSDPDDLMSAGLAVMAQDRLDACNGQLPEQQRTNLPDRISNEERATIRRHLQEQLQTKGRRSRRQGGAELHNKAGGRPKRPPVLRD